MCAVLKCSRAHLACVHTCNTRANESSFARRNERLLKSSNWERVGNWAKSRKNNEKKKKKTYLRADCKSLCVSSSYPFDKRWVGNNLGLLPPASSAENTTGSGQHAPNKVFIKLTSSFAFTPFTSPKRTRRTHLLAAAAAAAAAAQKKIDTSR